MNDILESLAAEENEIMEIVSETNGFIQDKPYSLDEAGVFDRYIDIHQEYSKHAKSNIEALKRALFIQWYSIAEPAFLSGIPGNAGPFYDKKSLDKNTEINILRLIDQMIVDNTLDEELKWMLSYYAIWDEYFQYYQSLKNLTHFLSQRESYPFPKKIDKEYFETRGQMGDYWISIICR